MIEARIRASVRVSGEFDPDQLGRALDIRRWSTGEGPRTEWFIQAELHTDELSFAVQPLLDQIDPNRWTKAMAELVIHDRTLRIDVEECDERPALDLLPCLDLEPDLVSAAGELGLDIRWRAHGQPNP